MEIQITNKEIFWAVESVWENLDYKLKYQIHQLVNINSEDDFIQTIEIDAASFIKIMKAVSGQPQGIAKDINPPLHLSLKNQILAIAGPIMYQLSTLTDEVEIEAFKVLNSEILTIASEVQSILVTNETMLNNKILNGKTQILS